MANGDSHRDLFDPTKMVWERQAALRFPQVTIEFGFIVLTTLKVDDMKRQIL